MKVTVKTNHKPGSKKIRNGHDMVTIQFSSTPSESYASELKRKGWKKEKNNSWTHYYDDLSITYACNLQWILSRQDVPKKMYSSKNKKYGKSKNSYSHGKDKSYDEDYERAFSDLREKKPMKRRQDFGLATIDVGMTSSYNCRTREVYGISC